MKKKGIIMFELSRFRDDAYNKVIDISDRHDQNIIHKTGRSI